MFMGKCRRNGTKPACISAAMARAYARAGGDWGHSFAAGNFSARYSRIASDSQMRASASASTGTFPLPEKGLTRVLKSVASSEMTSSANGIFATFMASHGRKDHDE